MRAISYETSFYSEGLGWIFGGKNWLRRKVYMKKYILVTLLTAMLVACNDETAKESEPNDQQQTETTQEIEQNEELTKSILEEEGIIAGQAYKQDELAVGTLSLESHVSNEDAKKLAEKYADELKKKYKDLPVNVQVVRDGKNVVDINLD